MMIFGRVSTAMVTPFDSKGNVDFQKTTSLVNYLLTNGTDSLVLSGTTGESQLYLPRRRLRYCVMFPRLLKSGCPSSWVQEATIRMHPSS